MNEYKRMAVCLVLNSAILQEVCVVGLVEQEMHMFPKNKIFFSFN